MITKWFCILCGFMGVYAADQKSCLIAPDGTPLPLTQAMLHTVMGPTCSIDILSNPAKLIPWYDQFEQDLLGSILSYDDAFHRLLDNNTKKIASAFKDIPHLTQPEMYNKLQNMLDPTAPVTPMQKLCTLIVICNDADQPHSANIPNLQKFPDGFQSAIVHQTLLMIHQIEKYTYLKIATVPGKDPKFSFLAFLCGLKHGRFILQIPDNFDGCHQWIAHGAFIGAPKFLLKHDIVAHMGSIMLAEKSEQVLLHQPPNDPKPALQKWAEKIWFDLKHQPSVPAQQAKNYPPSILMPVWNVIAHFYHIHEIPFPSLQKQCYTNGSISDDDSLYKIIKAMGQYNDIKAARRALSPHRYYKPIVAAEVFLECTQTNHRHWELIDDEPSPINFIATLDLVYDHLQNIHRVDWGPSPTRPLLGELRKLLYGYDTHCLLTDWPLCAPLVCGHSNHCIICITPTQRAIDEIDNATDYWLTYTALNQTVQLLSLALKEMKILFLKLPTKLAYHAEKRLSFRAPPNSPVEHTV